MAGATSQLPLTGDQDVWGMQFESAPPAAINESRDVYRYAVAPGYFEAMGIPLRRGRLLNGQDDGNAPRVAVISESVAKRRLPGVDAIGQRLRIGASPGWFTIVGIVGDVQVRGARGTNVVETYLGYWKMPEAGTNVVVKTAGDPAAIAEPLRRAVKELDPGISVSGIASMEQIIADANGPSRFYATLVAIFAGLALTLAAVGIYGVMSYAVAQRTPELGVRLALGAATGQIFALIVGETLKLAAIGLALGLAGSLVVGQALQKMLFGVRSTDFVTFAVTAAVLLLVALLASYLPARRAMRIDPMQALRVE